MTALRCAVLMCVLAAMAACSGVPATVPVAARDGDSISTSDLPAGYQSTDGAFPLYLKATVTETGALQLEPADAATANLSLRFIKRSDSQTMVAFSNTLASPVKLDLYISPDGKNYVYTSSCPILAQGGSYETWPHPVAWIALAQARVVDVDASACE